MVLMHGDLSVDVRRLAEQAKLSKIWSCPPEVAEEFSGWPVGATNPFVIKTPMPIYLEATVMDLPKILINGGGRGFLVEISPMDLQRVLPTRLVRCAKEKPVVVSKAP
jgi:Cys-tRNA(Pro) deacylase